jgi:hypothetical protein
MSGFCSISGTLLADCQCHACLQARITPLERALTQSARSAETALLHRAEGMPQPPTEMASLTAIKAALARIERIAQQTQVERVGFAGRLSAIEQSQGKLLAALNETSGRVMAIGNALGDIAAQVAKPHEVTTSAEVAQIWLDTLEELRLTRKALAGQRKAAAGSPKRRKRP